MRATLLGGGAALALTATVIGGAAPAAARGLVAGGGWPGFFTGYPYGAEYTNPPYAYPPAAPGSAYAANRSAASCAARFRSYDRSTGTYLGFDGARHPCP